MVPSLQKVMQHFVSNDPERRRSLDENVVRFPPKSVTVSSLGRAWERCFGNGVPTNPVEVTGETRALFDGAPVFDVESARFDALSAERWRERVETGERKNSCHDQKRLHGTSDSPVQ